MKFEQYNKAIDVLVEKFGMEEEKAIDIVNIMCLTVELKILSIFLENLSND